MRILSAALCACLAWAALAVSHAPANEIYEVLEAPAVPEDDAPSPSDRVTLEPQVLVDGDCSGPSVCDACCGPRWTVHVGALFLHRSDPTPGVLVTDSFAPGGNVVLDANQFDFGTAWGIEASVIRHNAFGTAWNVEGRYFGINNWSATVGPIASPGGTVVQYGTPIGNVFFPGTISGDFSSQLQSFELNGRRFVTEWLQVLAGVRHLELDERGLTLLQDIGPGLNLATHQIAATNQLWGFQLGVDGRLARVGRLELSSFAKLGIYGNSMDNAVMVTQNVGPAFASSASDTAAAFVGELGFVAQYQVTERWSVRATYQMLWLDSVALASNQIAVSDPAIGTATVDRGGDLFYQGGFIGAQFNW